MAVMDELRDAAKNNLNVLLYGRHGVGKTTMFFDVLEELGVKTKYFSGPTMDVWTELVGVPKPNEATKGLDFYRPLSVMDAECLIFDEPNRAAPKVMNAMLECIQFRSLNGEKLPNLRMVWAAINPPEKKYQVVQLDPAFLDRFDITIEVKSSPEVEVLVRKGCKRATAEQVVKWWKSLADNFKESVTPRRLEKICKIHDCGMSVKNSIPFGVEGVPIATLAQLLKNVRNDDLIDENTLRDPVKREEILKKMVSDTQLQLQVSSVISDFRFPRLFQFVDFIEKMDPDPRRRFFNATGQRIRRYFSDPDSFDESRIGNLKEQATRLLKMAKDAGVYSTP